MIGNSINHQDNRIEHELNHRGMSLQDDDTASIKSYGSHKNRPFKDESHKGSAETMEGEEKRDVSKEDLGLDEGTYIIQSKTHLLNISESFFLSHQTYRARRGSRRRRGTGRRGIGHSCWRGWCYRWQPIGLLSGSMLQEVPHTRWWRWLAVLAGLGQSATENISTYRK